jgi:hypothetical protein
MAASAQSLLLVLSQSPRTISRFPPSMVASRPTRQPTLPPSNIASHMEMVRCKFGHRQMYPGPAQTRYHESQNLHWKKSRPPRYSQIDRYLQIRLRTTLRRLSLHQPRTGRTRVLPSQRDLERILKIMMTCHRSRPQIQHPSEVRRQVQCRRRRQHLSPLPSRVSNTTLLLPSIRAPNRQPDPGAHSREGIT